ncbi:uncharacterized protein TNCV_3340671 [Trichonephila clavipes]|nr:uncharacterized protein TNCV_3340671 [Trichonephila clavipes]
MLQLQDSIDNFIRQLDVVPSQWSANVRGYLDEHVPRRRIGQVADYNMPLTQWPYRNCDLIFCDFIRGVRKGQVVHNHFHATYHGWWITHGELVAWPPCSPDLNPFKFFFWCHPKSLVYETPVATVEDLTARIDVASDDIANTMGFFECVRQSFVRRCWLSYDLLRERFE